MEQHNNLQDQIRSGIAEKTRAPIEYGMWRGQTIAWNTPARNIA